MCARPAYDVVIVGGGPAGATTALYAARAGLKVLLLDKRRFPRDKICGDAIARKAVGYLRDLGLIDAFELVPHEPIGAAVLGSPDGTNLFVDLNPERTPDQPHMVCRREIFDNVLWDAAARTCETWQEANVTDLIRSGDTVVGVRVLHNARTRDVFARAVVGADGFNSIVSRKLDSYRHSSKWWVATRAYYRNLDVAPQTVEVHYVKDSLPGFLWIFPTGDGIANVGLGMVHGRMKAQGERLRFVHERVVASPRFRDRFERADQVGDIHGWNLPTPDFSRTIAGRGFLMVGDAAGLVDPFSGEGIGNAMCAAHVAAQVIAEKAAATAASTANVLDLSDYPRRMWAAVDRDELKLHYRLRTMAQWGPAINFLIGRGAAHPEVLRWFQSMTTEDGVSQRRRLVSPLTFLRLLGKPR